MNKTFNLNIPICKVDEEKRMVYGYATMEQIDLQDEIVDYEASKKAFGEWIGNIREQHDGKKAIGKAIEIKFDDANRGVWVGAYISKSADGENAWTKIREGILTGYSIGGLITAVKSEVATDKKTGEQKEITRIMDYMLTELSVVDSPALGHYAQFVMVKSVGGQPIRTEVMQNPAKPYPQLWWMNKFAHVYDVPNKQNNSSYNNSSTANLTKEGASMANKEVSKSVWGASYLVDLACDLVCYIESKKYEGKDVSDLEGALATIKQAASTELAEGESYSSDVVESVEMAQQVVNLKKGNDSDMKKEEVKKSEELAKDESVEEEKVEDAEVKTESTEEEKTTEEVTEEETAGDEEAEEVEESEEEDAEKAVQSSDMEKAAESELSKAVDMMADLKKDVAKKFASFEKEIASLKEQLGEVNKSVKPAAAQASYVDVEKAEEKSVSSEMAEMKKQAEAYAADPTLGTLRERSEFVTKYQAAQRKEKQSS